ncbi:epoxyqueuosine reductase, partial [Bacteroides cellulosilyticus]|nr:epoxyqueuosine reductase [Bacteroides cellulosilyticus]
KVLKCKIWSKTFSRDEIVNIHGCSTCLKCLVHCPSTKTYIKRNIV